MKMTHDENHANVDPRNDDDFEDESSLEEITESFSGNELDEEFNEEHPDKQIQKDEPGKHFDEAHSAVFKKETQINEGNGIQLKKGLKKYLSMAGIGCLILLGGLYVYATFFNDGSGPAPTVQQMKTYRIDATAEGKSYSIVLDPFVIPYENKAMESTYVSLNLSIEVTNEMYRQGILHEKEALRALIYDRLVQDLRQKNDVPSLEDLKELIFETVNDAMATGRITRVYATNFIVV